MKKNEKIFENFTFSVNKMNIYNKNNNMTELNEPTLFLANKTKDNSVIYPTKEEHKRHIQWKKAVYAKLFMDQESLVNEVKLAHDIWVKTGKACMIDISFLNDLSLFIHDNESEIFLPFDIDLKSIDGFVPNRNDMKTFFEQLKRRFSKNLAFATISKSGKGIHFAINVDKECFDSEENFTNYLFVLETKICKDFFGPIASRLDTTKIFDRSLYNINGKQISYKNLVLSCSPEFVPYYNTKKTVPYRVKLSEEAGTNEIIDEKDLIKQIIEGAAIAHKTVSEESIKTLIGSNEGRLLLSRYITMGFTTLERVAGVIEDNIKNKKRLKELEAAVKNARNKNFDEKKVVVEKVYTLKNIIKNKGEDIYGNPWIEPKDYLEKVKNAKRVLVVSENTGAGKTTTLINSYENCLYIVPNISVLEQLEKTHGISIAHSQKEDRISFFKLGNRVGITYAFFNELIRDQDFIFSYIADNFKHIIFDEIDYVSAGTMYNIEKLTHFLNNTNDSQIVFCTATPFKCSLIIDFCDVVLNFKTGKSLKRNVTFFNIGETRRKFLTIIESFLNEHKGETNIIYYNNRKFCLKLQKTLSEYDIKLYNSKVKEIDLNNIEGNMLVTSSITAGLNMYTGDPNVPVNFLILGGDLTNSLVKQITGRVRNVDSVNIFLEKSWKHQTTVKEDGRYLSQHKNKYDQDILEPYRMTNVQSLIDFVKNKYIYHVLGKELPLSISFYWNHTVDRYNYIIFEQTNKNENFTFNEKILDIETSKKKLVNIEEELGTLDEISLKKEEIEGSLSQILEIIKSYNIEVSNDLLENIQTVSVLGALFEKQEESINTFKNVFYNFVNNFEPIEECYNDDLGFTNFEKSLKNLVKFNVISQRTANTLTRNNKYSKLYNDLFLIEHTRVGNVLYFKHKTRQTMIKTFIEHFNKVVFTKLSKKDIKQIKEYIVKYKKVNEDPFEIDFSLNEDSSVIKILEKYCEEAV